MMRALLLIMALPAAAAAQTMQAPTMGRMTALDVAMEPMMHVPTATYAARANAFDAWTVAASRVALSRSRSSAVLAFARSAGPAHAAALRTRGGAMTADADLAHALEELRSVPAARFDAAFASRQIAVHRRAWALHSGYAVDGADARLRSTAAKGVELEERDLHALPTRPMRY